MSSIVLPDGSIKLVKKNLPRIEPLRQDDAGDSAKLVRTINALVELTAQLAAALPLEYTEYQDVPVLNGVDYIFPHSYAGRVRWWVTDAQPTSFGANFTPLFLRRPGTTDPSDAKKLSLFDSSFDGKLTIRIAPVGA